MSGGIICRDISDNFFCFPKDSSIVSAHQNLMPVIMRQADAHELIERECKAKGSSIETLQGWESKPGVFCVAAGACGEFRY